MKYIASIIMLMLFLHGSAQTYDPSVAGIPTNKGIAIAQSAPVDSRSMFWDNTNFVYRAYVSKTEVMTYLNLEKYRKGAFPVLINTGGSLSGGVITGGINNLYWFKDGTTINDLVPMNAVLTVNGQTGAVVVRNADSIRTLPVDTSANRNNYVLTFDSTTRKFYLSSKGNISYSAGTGIDITNGVISALNTTALWNANQLRGRSISTNTPTSGQVLKWNGTSWIPSTDAASALDTAYMVVDTLYLVSGTDTLKVGIPSPASDLADSMAVIRDSLIVHRDSIDIHAVEIAALKDSADIHAGEISILKDSVDLHAQEISALIDSVNTHASEISILKDSADIHAQGIAALEDSIFVHRDSIDLHATRIAALYDSVSVMRDSIGQLRQAIIELQGGGGSSYNTVSATITTDTTISLSAGKVIEYILINPESNITSFKAGTSGDDEAIVEESPVTEDIWSILVSAYYWASTADVYLSGITSTTQIKIVYKTLVNEPAP